MRCGVQVNCVILNKTSWVIRGQHFTFVQGKFDKRDVMYMGHIAQALEKNSRNLVTDNRFVCVSLASSETPLRNTQSLIIVSAGQSQTTPQISAIIQQIVWTLLDSRWIRVTPAPFQSLLHTPHHNPLLPAQKIGLRRWEAPLLNSN